MSLKQKPDPAPKCIGKCHFSIGVRDYGGEKGIEEYYKCSSCGRRAPKRKVKNEGK